jgi:hypothetical protein
MIKDAGFADIEIGAAVDTFGEAKGEKNARVFDVRGYPFLAVKRRNVRKGILPKRGFPIPDFLGGEAEVWMGSDRLGPEKTTGHEPVANKGLLEGREKPPDLEK